MVTRVRLPGTPVPPPSTAPQRAEGPVARLVGLHVARDRAASVAERVRWLARMCEHVVVVDDGSADDTAARARQAGARVLELGERCGEGVALRAGLRLARELGGVGALIVDHEPLDDHLGPLLDGFVRAPEALLLGVGPGEVLAGLEWAQAAAEARGEEPPAYPDFRPPRLGGVGGRVERLFEGLVETRYSYPWGGPRVVPLQASLRLRLSEPGQGCHLELLARSVVAGVPSVEVALERSPVRGPAPSRRELLGLMAWLAPLRLRRGLAERLGLRGTGYAPPTTSPLSLLLAGSMLLALLGTGCPRPAEVVRPALASCADALPMDTWPGGGSAAAALEELLIARAAASTLVVEQQVRVEDPQFPGAQRLRGILAVDGRARQRLRLMAPMGMTVLDFVRADGRWQLTVPPAGIAESGEGDPGPDLALEGGAAVGVRPDRLAALVRSVAPEATVRWAPGRCAVLDDLDPDGAVQRRVAFVQDAERGWVVAREEIVEGGAVVLISSYDDYRPLDGGGLWPWEQRVEDLERGSRLELSTTALRTEGVTDAMFALLPES